ncbi:type IV fimbrial biogenesis protein FimT [Dyella jiangningensis]|uniref:GspH/FimT family pseudopilin n=1 Tax=Dyella sp. AtDHG13 TaxID=1938897 RepID=UPI0008916FE0|nr:GspH/FimT family pseudopilin [Dyella sp. AtDHG13]PXV54060.1 type IV fimbrial biogenesis protein FimT [Dyella sp. AtDHG13]SDL09492.1 type IV fimbrial biogenesis protein FimT [Dyella jiangningensis]
MRIDAFVGGGTRGQRNEGVTLIELLVTIAVAAVLMALAIPSFRNITLSNRLTTSANEVVSALQTARMEAIKRNARTQLCSDAAEANVSGEDDALGAACGTSAGTVVASASTTAIVVRESQLNLDGSLRLQGSVQALRFSAQGIAHATNSNTPYTGRVIDICTPSLQGDNHRVITMAAGSALQTQTTTDTCS